MTRVATLTTAYLATILAANWAITTIGVVPVGFGQAAPAGVLFVGLAFTLRDLLHETAGRWAVPTILGAIAAGSALSYAVAAATPRLAIGSAVAFAFSELADLGVYTPLRRRGRLVALAASNTVGLIVDSIVFLGLAFGSMAYLPGQILGKAWMTILAVAVLASAKRLRTRPATDAA